MSSLLVLDFFPSVAMCVLCVFLLACLACLGAIRLLRSHGSLRAAQGQTVYVCLSNTWWLALVSAPPLSTSSFGSHMESTQEIHIDQYYVEDADLPHIAEILGVNVRVLIHQDIADFYEPRSWDRTFTSEGAQQTITFQYLHTDQGHPHYTLLASVDYLQRIPNGRIVWAPLRSPTSCAAWVRVLFRYDFMIFLAT